MKPVLVAIHQPNFFPWLGYFDKIVRCAKFIWLDNVQFPKTGGTWENRVKLLVHGKPAWATMGIVRSYHGTQSINEVRINDEHHWRKKFLGTLEANYARASYFDVVYPFVSQLVMHPCDFVSEFNMFTLVELCKKLEIDTAKLIPASSLQAEGKSTDLLISLVRSVGGTAYLCGGGADGYQEDRKFQEAGIELVYQNFAHPRYPQPLAEEFAPGLSVIDSLFNCGYEETISLIRSGATSK